MEPKPPAFARLETNKPTQYRYSVCTLVTNIEEYGQMVQSFIDAGFTQDICEFRYIDNSSVNSFEAYKGLNLFLQNAQGEYIILCHQDILLNFHHIAQLEQQMQEITDLDPNWAILSNAGGIENDLYQRAALNVAYPDGFYQRVGKLPQKVISVDENFILVKRSANLALSGDLKGFHLYGTDICLVAELLGYSAYAIDFKLLHKSYGTPNETYYKILEQLINKYRHFMRSRRIITTIADFYLSESDLRKSLFESKWGKKVTRKITKINRDKSGIKTWVASKIYLFCPAGYATGGPECLHQLAYYLRKAGHNAMMYYYQAPESGPDVVHPNYEHYHIPYATTIKNNKINLIILPETHLGPLTDPQYKQIRKVIWWLSVDNFWVVLNNAISQKQHKSLFKIKRMIGRYQFPDLDMVRKSGAFNIVQSQYAEDFLNRNHILVHGHVHDYLSPTFIEQAKQLPATRKDYILYNPKKGLAFTQKLMEAAPQLQWKPLINLTPQQVADLLKESKVYIDFGEHPGRDRFPREAAVMGCCLITGLRGSAAFYEDVPIAAEFKFNEQETPLQAILDKITECLADFETQSAKFETYRQIVTNDQSNMEVSIKAIFKR